MSWYKNAQSGPLPKDQIDQHLLDRGFDPKKYNSAYDEESGTVSVNLYSPDGRLIGVQEYRPHVLEKGKKDESHSKRYFTEIPNENDKPTAFWGAENIDPNKPYLFVTEGVFDAAPINQLGEPAIALLTPTPSGSKIQQLKFLNKKLIAILDNDETGQAARLRGRDSGRVHSGHIRAVVEILGGVSHVVPDPYKDFGEMYQSDTRAAGEFIRSII